MLNAKIIGILLFLLIPILSANVTAIGTLSVNGTHLTINGTNITSTLVGVDETTLMAFAIESYVNGEGGYWGYNMNFPTFADDHLEVTNLTSLFYSYFWFCNYYNIDWVRISNGDSWATKLSYDAWLNHPTEYFELLDEMLEQASNANVYVSLNLAGVQANAFSFYGIGSVFVHNHTAGSSYANYLSYISGVIEYCDSSEYTNAIFSYDVFNEPDCDQSYIASWNNNKSAFHQWACELANDTTPLTTHIVEMGTGSGQFMGWGQSNFNYMTNTYFDVCHRHAYAYAEDTYLVTEPLHWANDTGKPLNVGEIASSQYYPLRIWPWWATTFTNAQGQSFAWMDLIGLEGYPYYGTYPVYKVNEDTYINATSFSTIQTFNGYTQFITFIIVIGVVFAVILSIYNNVSKRKL